MLSLEGKQLGNYDVIRKIRMGGMGAVYEGRQLTAFGRRVAIKVILGDYADDPEMQRRFSREARTVARLNHPGILPLIEFGEEHGILYLVMPFVEGGTLTQYLRRTLPSLDEVASIYTQLLDAVEYAHEQGLIHRDIKSSNVLLDIRRDGAPHIYLADFGLVRQSGRDTAGHKAIDPTQGGKPIPLDQVPGTPHYMAPEQTRGIVTPLTDVYALGVLLYQILTGDLPFDDEDDIKVIEMHLYDPVPAPSDRDASIPPELDAVVRKAMAKRPEDRYRDVAELRDAFNKAVEGPAPRSDTPLRLSPDDPIAVRKDSPAPPPPPHSRQREEKDPKNPAPLVIPARKRGIPPGAKDPRPTQETLKDPNPREGLPVVVRERRPRITDEPDNPAILPPRRRIDAQPGRSAERKAARVVPMPQRAHGRGNRKNDKKGRALGRNRQPIILPIILITITIVILIGLALMPRLLGMSFFPSGFPIFGTPPIASIAVTPQTQSLQDSYVLTGSPQIKNPDLATHTIPDRILLSSAHDSLTLRTTGTKTTGATSAHGTINFTNTGQSIELPDNYTLTSASGQRIQLPQGLTIPGQRFGQSGHATAFAIAVVPGQAGNLAAHALDGPCCTQGLTIKNPEPFTGGNDGQTIHIVAQSDLDAAQKQLTPALQQQVANNLKQQLTPTEVFAMLPTYQTKQETSTPVGEPSDQVTVTITIDGTAISYERTLAERMATQLLTQKAAQQLDKTYQLIDTPAIIGQPNAQQGQQRGVVYLNIAVRGTWAYHITNQQIAHWLPNIKGATPEAARAYLTAQPGILKIAISLPFGADHLPTNPTEIKITINQKT